MTSIIFKVVDFIQIECCCVWIELRGQEDIFAYNEKEHYPVFAESLKAF